MTGTAASRVETEGAAVDFDDVLNRLPAALRAEGVHVVEMDGWQQRGYDTFDKPVGQINHHTAIPGPCTDGTAAAMIRGRADLPGPLCNGHGGLDRAGRPVLYLVAGRRARHAGSGSADVLADVGRDVAPTGDARDRGFVDGEHGNRHFWGWEWQHPGDASEWKPGLIDLVVTCNAVLAELAGWSANRSIHHREWTKRKIDMSWRGDLRAMIANKMRGAAPPDEEDPLPTLDEDDKRAIKDITTAVVRAELTRALQFLLTGRGNAAYDVRAVGAKPEPPLGTAADGG